METDDIAGYNKGTQWEALCILMGCFTCRLRRHSASEMLLLLIEDKMDLIFVTFFSIVFTSNSIASISWKSNEQLFLFCK